ncbi:HNH endonuclease [Sporosarcina siberiensis]|uniref:HNH endonuclease n=1 Tax=Sporosarcina siberiensis TaxID=1365606 RepID=A0ABW4SC30_9BACL
MKLFSMIGTGVNTIGGGIVKAGVNLTGTLVSTKFPKTGDYIKEVGHTVVMSSTKVISNTAQFADGTATGAYGVFTKDEEKKSEGWADMKGASVNTAKGIVGGVVYTGKSVGQTVNGVIRQDRDQWTGGLQNLGKATAVMIVGVGVLEMIDADVVEAVGVDTRNMALDGNVHEVTGVPFESNTIEGADGVSIGIYPVFDAAFEAQLPEDAYLYSDTVHIGIANMDLYEAIQENPSLANDLGFNLQDVENLQSSVTPDGYDWHHHEEPGRMQLVEEEIHGSTGHTGGRNLWGGGTDAR